MKSIMFGGSAAILAGGLYVYNPYVGGQVYQMPVAQVYEKLADIDIPKDMGGGMVSSGMSGTEIDREENKSITWKLRENGDIVARFTAELSPMGPKATNVRVKFEIDPEGRVGKASPQLAQDKFIATMAKMAMDEQVDSTLMDREYNREKVGAQMLMYIMTHRAEIQAFMQNIDALMSEVSSSTGAQIGGPKEARVVDGGTGPMMSAGPQVNVDKYNR